MWVGTFPKPYSEAVVSASTVMRMWGMKRRKPRNIVLSIVFCDQKHVLLIDFKEPRMENLNAKLTTISVSVLKKLVLWYQNCSEQHGDYVIGISINNVDLFKKNLGIYSTINWINLIIKVLAIVSYDFFSSFFKKCISTKKTVHFLRSTVHHTNFSLLVTMEVLFWNSVLYWLK